MTEPTIASFERLLSQLEYLRADALAYVERHAYELAAVASEHRLSALNLLHYLALRQHDSKHRDRHHFGKHRGKHRDRHHFAGTETLGQASSRASRHTQSRCALS